MTQENSGQMASEPLLAAWINWTMDWDTMAQMGPGLNGAGRSGGQVSPETAVSGDPWLAALNLWQVFFSLLTEPGTVTAVFQGIQAPSKIILRMAQAGWGGYFYLHQQWLEGWQGGGSPSGEDGYENLDQNIFKACNEIFEQDFRRLLNLPHLAPDGSPPGEGQPGHGKIQPISGRHGRIHLSALSAGEKIPAGHGGRGGGMAGRKIPRKILRSTTRGG